MSGQEKDQAKQIFTSSAASGILTNDLVKILQDEKVSSIVAQLCVNSVITLLWPDLYHT